MIDNNSKRVHLGAWMDVDVFVETEQHEELSMIIHHLSAEGVKRVDAGLYGLELIEIKKLNVILNTKLMVFRWILACVIAVNLVFIL